VDELHRMLGNARQSDFEREAANRHRAKDVRAGAGRAEPVAPTPPPQPKRRGWLAFVTRASRAQA
jgi:hypothetical protein